jgi:hypothetical protein
MSGVVYLLWDPRNGNIRYVGKTSRPQSRFGEHIRGDTRKCHCRSWELSLIAQGLCCEISVVEDGLTAGESNESEKWWIAYGKQCGWPLTNHTDGGEGLCNPSPETREKMSLAKRGRALSPEHRKKIGAAHCGRVLSPEHVEKVAASLRGRVVPPEERKKMSDAARKRFEDPAERERNSVAQRERFEDPAEIEKISVAHRGHKHSLATRENMSIAQKMRYANPAEHEKTSTATRACMARKRLEEERDSPIKITGGMPEPQQTSGMLEMIGGLAGCQTT